MSRSLLDTDILSEVQKQKNPQVVLKAAAYLQVHQQFHFSAFTRYEMLGGWLPPILDRKSRNPREVGRIPCNEHKPVHQCRGGDFVDANVDSGVIQYDELT